MIGMKDDLTNKITGALVAEGGLPLVLKVSLPTFTLVRLDADIFTIAVNELWRFERMLTILGETGHGEQSYLGRKRWGCG